MHVASETVAPSSGEMSQRGARAVYELKLGAQMELGKGWTGWGHMGLQTASDVPHRNVEGLLGVKYSRQLRCQVRGKDAASWM